MLCSYNLLFIVIIISMINKMRFNWIIALLMLLATCCATLHAAKSAAKPTGKEDLNSYQIKIVTYNVAGLPDFITFNRKLAPTKTRFAHIGDLLKKYDIICLQEMFIKDREIIEKKLPSYYVVHGADVGEVKLLGSGVYTFSRWPVTSSHYEKWEHLTDADMLSLKGFVAATVVISPTLSIDVYNLHGQTGKSQDKAAMKIKNFERLAKYMDYQSGGSGRPVLLLGDFNIKTGDEVWNSIMKNTGVVAIPDPVKGKPDHLFYKENGSGWRITVVETGTEFIDPDTKKKTSDHIAFQATLKFEK